MTGREQESTPSRQAALTVLDLLSGKWHPVVVVTLLERGPLGFNELLEAIPEVSGKVLSGTLEELDEADVVDRTVVSESPLRVTYDLTEGGRALEPVLQALDDWGERYLEPVRPSVVLADGDPRITEMFRSWLGDRYDVERVHDGEAVQEQLRDSPDVLLLEWSLPGPDVTSLIESAQADCRTVLLVGKRPSLDLLDVPCDDVLRKPVVRNAALETIETQLESTGQSEQERTRTALRAKCSLLESVHSRESLERTLEFFEASTRIKALEEAPER